MILLAACYVPTTVGLRTDGLLAAAGRGEAAVVGGEMLNGIGEPDWPPGPGYGLTGHFSLADGVAVSGSVARYDTLSGLEAEARVRVADEAKGPLTIAVLAGAGTVWGDDVARTWGTHLGLVASHEVAWHIRPFVGARANPILANDLRDFRMFVDGGAGISWRPPLTEHLAGLLLVEGDWVHGADAAYADDGAPANVDAYVAMGLIGVSWR